MVRVRDLSLDRDKIILPDDTVITGLVVNENYDALVEEYSSQDARALMDIYDNVFVQQGHFRLLYVEGGGVLFSPLHGVLSGMDVREIDNHLIAVPPSKCAVVMDEDDSDDDPETANIYFISLRD